MPLLYQCPKMLLERVAVAAGQADSFRHGDAAMFPGKFDDLQGEGRHGSQHQFFPFQFAVESAHLLGQGFQEEQQPGLPIRRFGTDGALGLPQCQVKGWSWPVARSSLDQSTSSVIRRGVSNGLAVSTTPGGLPASSKAATLLLEVL